MWVDSIFFLLFHKEKRLLVDKRIFFKYGGIIDKYRNI